MLVDDVSVFSAQTGRTAVTPKRVTWGRDKVSTAFGGGSSSSSGCSAAAAATDGESSWVRGDDTMLIADEDRRREWSAGVRPATTSMQHCCLPRLTTELPLGPNLTPALLYRAPPRRDANSFKKDLSMRASSARVQPRYNQTAHSQCNVRGAAVIVDRYSPSVSWDMAMHEHVSQNALGGPCEFGVVDDNIWPRRPAGAAHLNCGVWSEKFGGEPPISPHFSVQTVGFTEETKRNFILTGERKRRGSNRRQARTYTIPGLGSTSPY